MSEINAKNLSINNLSFICSKNIKDIDLKTIHDTGGKIGGWTINKDSQIDIHTEAKDPD